LYRIKPDSRIIAQHSNKFNVFKPIFSIDLTVDIFFMLYVISGFKATPHNGCCAIAPSDFFVRLSKKRRQYFVYCRAFLGDMTEKMQASVQQRLQPLIARCCLKMKQTENGRSLLTAHLTDDYQFVKLLVSLTVFMMLSNVSAIV
jgi:hypothetical protein